MKRRDKVRSVVSWAAAFAFVVATPTTSTVMAQPARPPLSKRSPPAPTTPVKVEDENLGKDASTEINVKNADIAAIVKIFSKKTKRNYILDDRVKGKVSIYLPGKVSADEALRILESVLSFKGFTSVPIGENLWKIVPSREARQTTIPTIDESSDTPTAAVVTRLLHLKYVSADEMKQLVSQLISADGLVNAYTGTNSLIVIDSEDNISRVQKLIAELDVPFTNQDMTIIPVVHADANDVAEKINEILGEKNKKGDGASAANEALFGGVSGRPVILNGQPPAGGGGNNGGGGASSVTVSSRAKEPKIIPDERTNSIIVIADEDTTLRIRALISQLDSKVDLSGSKFYVYRCQHANADDLAQVLSGLVGGSSGGTKSSTKSGGSGPFDGSGDSANGKTGLNRTSSGSSFGSGSGGSGGGFGSGGSNSSKSSKAKTGTVSLGDNISITADPATNSLIISAGKTDYQKIKSLLEKLDIKRRQVLVEAMLLEVTVNNDEQLGVDFLTSAGGKNGGLAFKGDFSGNFSKFLSDPASLSNFSVAAASAGTLTLPNNVVVPSQASLITALKGNSNVNVLSSPNILTTDNEEAQIQVGEKVPFISSTSKNETNLNNTFNQVDRQDVGITLRLTPQISSGDSVTLKIYTEVSNVVSGPLDAQLGPTTQQRKSETTVIAKDSQMIVIGGLMSDDLQDSKSGVPFLRDIPVLGFLFGTTKSSVTKRNLLIFITPHVIKDQYDARDITIQQRDRVDGTIEEFKIEPNRKDLLHSLEIDKVAEANPYEGPKPSTILPTTRSTSPGEAVELNVAPKLPTIPEQKQESAPTTLPPLAPRVGSDISEKRQDELGTFIVLRVDTPLDKETQQKLPFSIVHTDGAKGGDFVAITIPTESDPAAKGFFVVGKTYHYRVDGKEIDLSAQGVYSSGNEAKAILGGPLVGGKTFYTLSPYELMNLGAGPWSN